MYDRNWPNAVIRCFGWSDVKSFHAFVQSHGLRCGMQQQRTSDHITVVVCATRLATTLGAARCLVCRIGVQHLARHSAQPLNGSRPGSACARSPGKSSGSGPSRSRNAMNARQSVSDRVDRMTSPVRSSRGRQTWSAPSMQNGLAGARLGCHRDQIVLQPMNACSVPLHIALVTGAGGTLRRSIKRREITSDLHPLDPYAPPPCSARTAAAPAAPHPLRARACLHATAAPIAGRPTDPLAPWRRLAPVADRAAAPQLGRNESGAASGN